MINHFISAQFLLFLLVGATAAALNWIVRYAISIWFSYSVAVALAYCVGITVAFELNRRFVFTTSTKPVKKQARDFIFVNLLFFPVVWGASLLLKSLLLKIGFVVYVEGIAHGVALTIPALLTFLIYKYITFGNK